MARWFAVCLPDPRRFPWRRGHSSLGGIPSTDGDRVFEAFYRGDEARSEDGAGLGLAISRAIVEAHGGRIWLEQGAGPGTSVHFTLRSA
jgi:signal transduction histidine kinase